MTHSPGREVLRFFVLTFAGTWACWLVVLRLGGIPADGAWTGLRTLLLVGTFVPSLVAIGLTAARDGRTGLRGLLGRLFRGEVHPGWYVFALLYYVSIQLVGALLLRALTGDWPRFTPDHPALMLAATFLSLIVGGQSGEEIGWRGYALPRLATTMGLRWASLLLGVVWALWHLPLFYVPGADLRGQSFPFYVVHVAAISVAIAWVYAGTRGSLLLTMLMHAAINNLRALSLGREPLGDPFSWTSAPLPWLVAAVAWVVAGALLLRMNRGSQRHTLPDLTTGSD